MVQADPQGRPRRAGATEQQAGRLLPGPRSPAQRSRSMMTAGEGQGIIEVCLDPGTPTAACRTIDLSKLRKSPRNVVDQPAQPDTRRAMSSRCRCARRPWSSTRSRSSRPHRRSRPPPRLPHPRRRRRPDIRRAAPTRVRRPRAPAGARGCDAIGHTREVTDGTAGRTQGAHLRGGQRPLHRMGHRQGVP